MEICTFRLSIDTSVIQFSITDFQTIGLVRWNLKVLVTHKNNLSEHNVCLLFKFQLYMQICCDT